jgi:hypothetical protein
MATFDQLAADQRAIIELVLRRDRSYDQIGEMLDLPPARVRELARDALGELAPFTAELVDAQWRGQLADYVLGQQAGPESQATRGHLRRSEPARIWTYSLLDALDDFYEDGARPEIPAGDAGGGGRARTRERPTDANGEASPGPLARASRPRRTGGGVLSPAAQSALMRRRVLGGLGAAIVLALLIFGAIQIFGGDDAKKPTKAASTTGTGATGPGQSQVAAQAVLAPIGNVKGQGAALVYESGNQVLMVMRAKLPATKGKDKYVIWLYNSEKQLVPLAADVTDKSGNFQGAAALPANWKNYRFVDVTLQATGGKSVRHQNSVMRGPLTAPTAAATGATGTTGTTGP